MTFEEKITEQIKDAMKSKNKERLEALRAVKSAILLEKTKEGATGEISDETYIKMLQKLAKQRDDSAIIYQQQNRPELAIKEENEALIIREFLPKPLTIEEIETTIKVIIAETSANGIKDMGKVMGKATSKFAGRADSKQVSEIVKKLLA